MPILDFQLLSPPGIQGRKQGESQTPHKFFCFLLPFDVLFLNPKKMLSSSCVAKLNELYIFFSPRCSEYTLCCLCIYFVFAYVLTSDNEIYVVGIQKALSSSRATTLISMVDAWGFLALVCVWLLPCSRMKYVWAAGVVGRNKMITEDPEGEASIDNSNSHHDNNFLLLFDLFLIFLDWWYFVRWRKTFMEPKSFHWGLVTSHVFNSKQCFWKLDRSAKLEYTSFSQISDEKKIQVSLSNILFSYTFSWNPLCLLYPIPNCINKSYTLNLEVQEQLSDEVDHTLTHHGCYCYLWL